MGMSKDEAIEWLNAIKDKYIHGGDDYYDGQRRMAIDWAIHLLHEDAVTVVRCKDCKHYGSYGRVWGCPISGAMSFPGDNNFCSYGERREGE